MKYAKMGNRPEPFRIAGTTILLQIPILAGTSIIVVPNTLRMACWMDSKFDCQWSDRFDGGDRVKFGFDIRVRNEGKRRRMTFMGK